MSPSSDTSTDAATTPEGQPIRVGISTCLLGHKVRFDGGHKHDRYLTNTLGNYFEWVPVCPEVEVGLGTPRESIHLIRIDGDVRLRTTRTELDLTTMMSRFVRRRVAELAKEQLSGFILKKDSPSCGMERVKIHAERGSPQRTGRGLFAEALLTRFPDLPVEEEGRLCDPRLRENWVERVFAYFALQQLWRRRWKIGDLVDFHTRYKLVLLAHSETHYRELGRLVARAKTLPRAELRAAYQQQFMAAMRRLATTRRNTNVLQHMLGYLKRSLDSNCRQELAGCIEDYRRGLVPLVVPVTLIRHYVRLLDIAYLRDQVYLNPHPKELALRNHV